MFFVYILQSFKDSGFYVGLTANVDKRLQTHNAGRVRSTKARIPFKVVYTESFPSRIEAREREKYLKSYKGASEKMTILDKIR